MELESNKPVKAQEINQNFSHIKSIMDSKSIPVSFKVFSSNEVIDNEDFESEFDKVRSLGVEVNALDSSIVKAQELNIAFGQMALGVTSYDDIPLAQEVIFSTNEDVAYVGNFPVINYTGPTSIEIISSPSKGTLVKNNLSFTYTPQGDYSGPDSFTYRAFDGKNYSDTKIVNISVLPVNDAPIILAQSFSSYESVGQNLNIVASDVDNTTLTYSILTPPTKGSLSGIAPNLVYTANSSYVGADSFIVQVSDGNLSAQATMSINVSSRIGITKGSSYRSYSNGAAATSCAEYQSNPNPIYIYSGSTGNGVYLVDPDGGSLSNAYSEYCNFTAAVSYRNYVQVELAAAGYQKGPTFITINGVGANPVSYGRGWTIVAYNKNFEQLSWGSYDVLGSSAANTSMANYLNSLPNGTIIAVVTADEPATNFNSTASTALSRYGCSVPGLAYRSAYVCLGMKTSAGAAKLLGQFYHADATHRGYNLLWRSDIRDF